MKTNQLPLDISNAKSKDQLVYVYDGQPMTSSLQVALHFGKRHNDVLKAIRELDCSPEYLSRNFASLFYIREIGNNAQRKYPLVYMTKDGFTFLVMGFTGKVAAKFKEDYINAFNEMEKTLKTDAVPKASYDQALKQIKELLANKSPKSAPKSIRPAKMYHLTEAYYDAVVNSFLAWLDCENTNSFAPDIRDKKLTDRFKAARLLYFDYKKSAPITASFQRSCL